MEIMSIEKVIARIKNNAEYECTHGNLQGCLEFRQLAKWLEKLQKIQEVMDSRPDDSAKSNSKALGEIEVIMYGNDD